MDLSRISQGMNECNHGPGHWLVIRPWVRLSPNATYNCNSCGWRMGSIRHKRMGSHHSRHNHHSRFHCIRSLPGRRNSRNRMNSMPSSRHRLQWTIVRIRGWQPVLLVAQSVGVVVLQPEWQRHKQRWPTQIMQTWIERRRKNKSQINSRNESPSVRWSTLSMCSIRRPKNCRFDFRKIFPTRAKLTTLIEAISNGFYLCGFQIRWEHSGRISNDLKWHYLATAKSVLTNKRSRVTIYTRKIRAQSIEQHLTIVIIFLLIQYWRHKTWYTHTLTHSLTCTHTCSIRTYGHLQPAAQHCTLALNTKSTDACTHTHTHTHSANNLWWRIEERIWIKMKKN